VYAVCANTVEYTKKINRIKKGLKKIIFQNHKSKHLRICKCREANTL
jgi:hypothetical protein